MSTFDLALSLAPARPVPAAQALADRVRLVLETEPGTVPFAPGVGCALGDLAGAASTASRVAELKRRVEDALRRQIPGIVVLEVAAQLVPEDAPGASIDVPIAERALASAGRVAAVELRVLVRTPEGVASILAQVGS